MKIIIDAIRYFQDFYSDFNVQRALVTNKQLLNRFAFAANQNWTAFKGNKKVQLILRWVVESRLVSVLDEPPVGLIQQHVIIFCGLSFKTDVQTSFLVLISTHLIADIERKFWWVIFINCRRIPFLHENVDCFMQRNTENAIDEIFPWSIPCLLGRTSCVYNY